MYLKIQDMINIIIRAFNDCGYKRTINKRLVFGFNRYSLNCSECNSLNRVVKELDNRMLDKVYFEPIMSTDNFDLCICRLLYVSGHWEELCHYIMLIKFGLKECEYIIEESESEFFIVYLRRYMKTTIYVDCQKMGVIIKNTIENEMEF